MVKRQHQTIAKIDALPEYSVVKLKNLMGRNYLK